VADLKSANFFRDRDVQDNPYPYSTRAVGVPVWQEPHFGVFLVTGHDEALAVYTSGDLLVLQRVSGPFMAFPRRSRGTTSPR